MLIVLVIVLGLAIFLASTMFKSADKTAGAINSKTDQITGGPAGGQKGVGEECGYGSECVSGNCLSSGRCA